MSKEIFEEEKPVEQTNDPEGLEYKLNPRKRPERQEQTKTGELVDRAKKELGKVYKRQEATPEKTGKQRIVNAEEFFDEAKSKEKDIKLSVIGRTVEAVSNTGKSQEVRDGTAERKVPEIIKALGEMEDDLENIKKNFKVILDVGAGWGENLRNLVKELGAEKGIAIDDKTVLSENVRSDEKVGDKLTMVSGDAIEEMKRLENNSIDLSMAVALLQVVGKEDKIKILGLIVNMGSYFPRISQITLYLLVFISPLCILNKLLKLENDPSRELVVFGILS